MAINKKLIHFQNLADFETRLANNEILNTSIVFIKDAKKIWTHGNYYDGSTVDLTNIENSIDNKVDKVSGKGLSTNDYTTEEKNKLAGAYTKPSGGIPKTDLTSAVQTSLGKADTALQAHQDISVKQDKLVSGTNIKTINGQSILGSGDIAISANITETDPVFTASPAHTITADDISAWNDKMDETPVLNHGTGDTTCSIAPNIFHLWGTVTSLNITLATPDDSTILNEYMFQFTSGATATVLSLPSDIVWISEPTIEASKTYQISIVNNLAVIGGF